MSNRTLGQTTDLAALRLAHELQIEALVGPAASERERVLRFAEAAGLTEGERRHALEQVIVGISAARAVWVFGHPQMSLFAHLPGCSCPAVEHLPGVPHDDELFGTRNWRPSRAVLERFAAIQQERRG